MSEPVAGLTPISGTVLFPPEKSNFHNKLPQTCYEAQSELLVVKLTRG